MEREIEEIEEKEPFQRVYGIIFDEGKFVFVRDKDERNPGKYIKFPGGGVEETLTLPNGKTIKRTMFKEIPDGAISNKETPFQALEREIYEETHLITTPGKLIIKYVRELTKMTTMARWSPNPFIQTLRETEELFFYQANISGFYNPEPGLETEEIIKLSPSEIYEAIKDGRLAIYEEGSRNIFHTRVIHRFIIDNPELF